MRVRVERGIRFTGLLGSSTREGDAHLGARDSAALYPTDGNPNLGEAEALRESGEPGRGSSRIEQGSEQHVAADTRGGVENREVSGRHRAVISPPGHAGGKSPEGR